MTGDFANMARQSSIKAINKKNGRHSNGHEAWPQVEIQKAALLASNGKLCFSVNKSICRVTFCLLPKLVEVHDA